MVTPRDYAYLGNEGWSIGLELRAGSAAHGL